MLKFILSFFIAICCISAAIAQKELPVSEILSPAQVTALFNDSVKKAFDMRYPIFQVYHYSDKSGSYFCALMESHDSTDTETDSSGAPRTDTFNRAIKAVDWKEEQGGLKKMWEMNDHIIKSDARESSIWFWSRSFDFKEVDDDGLVIPILFYGTYAMNGFDDGRVKILIYYKGKKMAIRHQNGVLDGQRETNIDDAVYTLPLKVRQHIKARMINLEKQDKAIFTAYPVD